MVGEHYQRAAADEKTQMSMSEGSVLVGMYSWGLQPMTQAA